MKLRNPLIMRLLALLVSWLLRAWIGTVSLRTAAGVSGGGAVRTTRRGIYLFWHEVLLLPTGHVGHGFSTLISRHADGELITQTVRMLGGHVVRGSTNRAGMTAVRELMRAGRVQHLAITPDGPRGPRRVLQPGAVYLAGKTGMPLIPIGIGVRDCWRAKSWDRMVLPKPGTLAVVIFGEPLDVPSDLERATLGQYVALAQAAMDDVQRRAESLAADRRAPLTAFSADVRLQGG